MAQIIVAVQMVLEEKFVYKHDVHPLRAVGTEGVYTLIQQSTADCSNKCNILLQRVQRLYERVKYKTVH